MTVCDKSTWVSLGQASVAIVVGSLIGVGTLVLIAKATNDGMRAPAAQVVSDSTLSARDVRALAVEGQALAQTTAEWSEQTFQKERAYCAAWTMRNDTLVLYAVRRPVSRSQSWDTITFECDPDELPLHTHPPQDCNPTGTYCAHTNWREKQCAGSQQDALAALDDGLPLGIVQCGRETFGAYFAPTFRQPVKFVAGAR